MGSLENEELLLDEEATIEDGYSKTEMEGEMYTDDGSVDISECQILRYQTGTWRACPFIIGIEFAERFAYHGISVNLVSYLTKILHQGNASAAIYATTWQGTCYLTPLLGASLADSYWGRYRTISIFSLVYLMGMAILTLAASITSLKPPPCEGVTSSEASGAEISFFFVGLYLIAIGTGGIKPCVSSFGADQFDETSLTERAKKDSFFGWFYFTINIGSFLSSSFLVWIQDNAGWGLGFGIPTLLMALAVGAFFSATTLYRFKRTGESPLKRACQALVASILKWNHDVLPNSSLVYESEERSPMIHRDPKLEASNSFRFFSKAAITTETDSKRGNYSNALQLCTVSQVEEIRTLVGMFPIWATGIMFSAVYSLMTTVFVEQGMTLDNTIGSFRIPPASLTGVDIVTVIAVVPLYHRIVAPMARKITGHERGFSLLQRMGIGLFISSLAVIVAALLETKRLAKANHNRVHLNILCQLPQYILMGLAEVFTYIGQLEFFYEESPDGMRSLCSALSLLTNALGDYLCSMAVVLVMSITTRGGRPGWIPDDLNQGHLDYFFWLMAGLNLLNLLIYIACARKYKYKQAC